MAVIGFIIAGDTQIDKKTINVILEFRIGARKFFKDSIATKQHIFAQNSMRMSCKTVQLILFCVV